MLKQGIGRALRVLVLLAQIQRLHQCRRHRHQPRIDGAQYDVGREDEEEAEQGILDLIQRGALPCPGFRGHILQAAKDDHEDGRRGREGDDEVEDVLDVGLEINGRVRGIRAIGASHTASFDAW